jgi:hypothetical protein
MHLVPERIFGRRRAQFVERFWRLKACSPPRYHTVFTPIQFGRLALCQEPRDCV